MEKILSNERIDDIGFSEYRLIQNIKGFCYGIDAVLIASFARVKSNGVAADLGTGSGIIPLILKHKYSPAKIYALEVQSDVAEMARRTVKLNNLEESIEIINTNVKNASEHIKKGSLDMVVTNPPYVASGEGIISNGDKKAISRHEISGNLEDFISCAFTLLREKGDFYIIHRPSRLVDVVFLCRKYRLEPKKIQFIQPKEGVRPNIFMLHCVKYGNPELKFIDPICVYDNEGKYTNKILEIYERK